MTGKIIKFKIINLFICICVVVFSFFCSNCITLAASCGGLGQSKCNSTSGCRWNGKGCVSNDTNVTDKGNSETNNGIVSPSTYSAAQAYTYYASDKKMGLTISWAAWNSHKFVGVDIACKHSNTNTEKYVGNIMDDKYMYARSAFFSWDVSGWEYGNWDCWSYSESNTGLKSRNDFSITKTTFPTCESISPANETNCGQVPDNGDTCELYNGKCQPKSKSFEVHYDANGGVYSDWTKNDSGNNSVGNNVEGNSGNKWCSGSNEILHNGGCYTANAENCKLLGICNSNSKCSGKCTSNNNSSGSTFTVNFYASGGQMRCNSPFVNTDANNCSGTVSAGKYNFPSSYTAISDGSNKLIGWTKLLWDGQPNCNSNAIEKTYAFEVDNNINYFACFQEIIGGLRYVKDDYVADGGSVEYKCGEQIFVDECIKSGSTNYCFYNDNTGAKRKIYRDKLTNSYEAAIAGCDETGVSVTEINGWRYPIISSDKYECGEGLYITNCTEGTCNFTRVSKYNVGEIDVNGTITKGKFVESTEIAKIECGEIELDNSDKKCDYKKIDGNSSGDLYTICYEKNTTISKIKELVKKYYVCDEKKGYYFDDTSLVSLGKENCNKNNICTDVYNVNCKKKDANPTLSVKSAVVGSNGKGIISVTGYARVGKITEYYYSENFIAPTNNTKGWINTNSDTFTIESTPGIIYIWVKDSKGNISNAVSGVVIDTVNTNTTVKELKLYDSNGNIQAPTTGITYNNSMKSNNYVRLSNDLIKDSEVLADGFNPFDMEYKLEVDSPTVTVYATLTSKDSKYVEGYEPRTVNLNYGVNTVLIKIMNNEGKIRTYTILVTRKDTRISDNTLKDISLSVGKINFNANVTDYKIEIPNSTKEVEVKSIITSDKASYIEGYEPGNVVIDSDSTVKLIKIKSQTGTTRTYVLTFVKEGTDIISKDSLQLADLVIPGTYIAFESNISNYSLSVDYQTDVIDLMIPTKDSKAYTEVSIKKKSDTRYNLVSNEGIGLDVGENFIEIKVTDSSGNYSYYRLTIIRKEFGLEISKDTSLKDLKVLGGYNIKFEPNKKDYTLKIKQEKNLVITAVPSSNRAEVFIRGNEELTGFSTVRIKVIAENGEYETYSIDIKKDAFNKPMEITAIIVGFVIILGSSCIIVIKNKNKNKNDYYNE